MGIILERTEQLNAGKPIKGRKKQTRTAVPAESSPVAGLHIQTAPRLLKAQIINILGNQEKRTAEDIDRVSELLVNAFLQSHHVYATREDVSPELWIYHDGIYIPKGKTYIEEFCRAELEQYYSTSIVSHVVAKIKADRYIAPEKFFSAANLEEIPVLNGILHKEKRTLRPYSPEDIFFNKMPVVYVPDADCPAIDKHFDDVLSKPEDKKVLYELVGYCLDKIHFIEKAFMFVGHGRNGKGKTLELIKRFVGAENVCSVPLTSMRADSFNLHQMFGKLVNLAGDLNNTDLKETGLFKSITGRDVITAHRKFMTDLIFTSTCKNIFACNELPKVYDISLGFWSRWILLEFPYEFIKQSDYEALGASERRFKKIMEPNHIETLCTPSELSGLLNKALDGLARLQQQKDFSYTVGTAAIKDKWIRMSNSFTAFCLDKIEAVDSNEIYISKTDMRRAFNKYCKQHKLKGAGDREIKATLEDMFGAGEGRKREDDEFVHVWTGVAYKGNEDNKI